MTQTVERLAAVHRYAGVEPPTDGSFDLIAEMAAMIFETPMATVSVVDTDRVWFLATQGLDGVTEIGAEPGLCASAILGAGPYVVNDAAVDPRTLDHPLVRGELGLRFYAAAPIVTVEGHALGTVNVLDRKRHRRVTQTQTTVLSHLAATVAQMLQVRLSALAVLRAERATQAERAQPVALISQRMDQAIRDQDSAGRPSSCQFGGNVACQKPAEVKVADSWGDSAWGCWQHAEEALINVVPAFLATESPYGLAAHRARAASALDHP
ncbi:MAG TPA: GAF domain-containing protein [Kineosporiaceae bacterium]|nr:GAF domain-containing protein [Kineosporiaceae bacterium]